MVECTKYMLMKGFTFSGILETKGNEYFIIIVFLVVLVSFFIVLNKQLKIKKKLHKPIVKLSRDILKIPQGIFYCHNHTWVHLGKSGAAEVGMDDFLMHVIGEVKFTNLKSQGDVINKGELLATIEQDGKVLSIFSPLSGEIMAVNPIINSDPGVINIDPYGQGWIYKLKPVNWLEETNSYYLAEDASKWTNWEWKKVKDFLAGSLVKQLPDQQGVVLQDGGELSDHVLSELHNDIWHDFQKEFLNPVD